MAMHRMSFIGLAQDAPTKAAMRLPLPANVRKDVFLSALLEMPTTKRANFSLQHGSRDRGEVQRGLSEAGSLGSN